MSGHWGAVAESAFFIGVILGDGIYFLLKRRRDARFGLRQRALIGWIGLGGSFLVSGALLCVRPDVPASSACAIFLWGMSGSFFMLLLSNGKFGSFGLGR